MSMLCMMYFWSIDLNAVSLVNLVIVSTTAYFSSVLFIELELAYFALFLIVFLHFLVRPTFGIFLDLYIPRIP